MYFAIHGSMKKMVIFSLMIHHYYKVKYLAVSLLNYIIYALIQLLNVHIQMKTVALWRHVQWL